MRHAGLGAVEGTGAAAGQGDAVGSSGVCVLEAKSLSDGAERSVLGQVKRVAGH